MPASVSEYIAASPPGVRTILKRLRATVRKAAPQAEERISYRMPAYFQDGVLVYFAAFARHIGIYPPVRDASLQRRLQRYAGPKGNLKFPLAEPIPYDLIARIVRVRLKQNRARKAARTGA